jgi:hypothetical protein
MDMHIKNPFARIPKLLNDMVTPTILDFQGKPIAVPQQVKPSILSLMVGRCPITGDHFRMAHFFSRLPNYQREVKFDKETGKMQIVSVGQGDPFDWTFQVPSKSMMPKMPSEEALAIGLAISARQAYNIVGRDTIVTWTRMLKPTGWILIEHSHLYTIVDALSLQKACAVEEIFE